MSTWNDVRRIALGMLEADERMSNEGVPRWRVKDKLFGWERRILATLYLKRA